MPPSHCSHIPTAAAPQPFRGALPHVRRFDGRRKSSRTWHALRKDDELWMTNSNCLVYLYAPRTSQRGPSLNIPLSLADTTKCPSLFGEFGCASEPPSPSATSDNNSDSGYGASLPGDHVSRYFELHIPAPLELTRNEAFLYHIGTRNFFAYLLNKPLVGEHLGQALVNLASRIETWQPKTGTSTDLVHYCREQGYLDCANNIDYAVASLRLADETHIKEIWFNSFAHCVGMRSRLDLAPEVEFLSDTTRSLITQSGLEMEKRVMQATSALGNFLEDEFGPDRLGISKPLRDHLDRFRSVIHTYYVNNVGYFPPNIDDAWTRRIWHRMHEDLQSVYGYLADMDSSADRVNNRGLNGGICVTQNTKAFDERHEYPPLPHLMPLEPDVVAASRTEGERMEVEQSEPRRRFKINFNFHRQISRAIPKPSLVTSRQALAHASNACTTDALSSSFVQEYIRFEWAPLQEKIPVVEARKVRWLLIYCLLQKCISITSAPSGVRESSISSYPLCVRPVQPSWTSLDGEHLSIAQKLPCLHIDVQMTRPTLELDRISIHPDCEADSAEDFFSMNSLSRSGTQIHSSVKPPSRNLRQVPRSASLRSSVNSLHHSIRGRLNRANSHCLRPGSLLLPKRFSFYDQTYGCGEHNEEVGFTGEIAPTEDPHRPGSEDSVDTEKTFSDLEVVPLELDRDPSLHLHQIHQLHLLNNPVIRIRTIGENPPLQYADRYDPSAGKQSVLPAYRLEQFSAELCAPSITR